MEKIMNKKHTASRGRVSTAIEGIEKKLHDLDLGVETWISIGYRPSGEYDSYHHNLLLGFALFKGSWHLVIKPLDTLEQLFAIDELADGEKFLGSAMFRQNSREWRWRYSPAFSIESDPNRRRWRRRWNPLWDW